MKATSPVRPTAVLAGSGFLAGSLAIALTLVLLNAFGYGPTEPSDPRWTAFFAGSLVFEGLLVLLAFRGHNWARIACVVIGVLTILAYPESYTFLQTHHFHPLALFGFASGLLSPLGAVCLLLPPANAWYEAVKPARAAV